MLKLIPKISLIVLIGAIASGCSDPCWGTSDLGRPFCELNHEIDQQNKENAKWDSLSDEEKQRKMDAKWNSLSEEEQLTCFETNCMFKDGPPL